MDKTILNVIIGISIFVGIGLSAMSNSGLIPSALIAFIALLAGFVLRAFVGDLVESWGTSVLVEELRELGEEIRRVFN